MAAAARVAYPIHLDMPIVKAATASLTSGLLKQVHGLMLTGHSTITKSPAKSAALRNAFSEHAENSAFLLWPVAVIIPLKQTTSKSMNTRNSATVINSEGESVYFGYVTMQRGCPQTRSFAMFSNEHVPKNGVSFVIGQEATPEAVRAAIARLESYLSE